MPLPRLPGKLSNLKPDLVSPIPFDCQTDSNRMESAEIAGGLRHLRCLL